MQKFVQQSNDEEEARIPWLYPTALRSPKSIFPNPSPAQRAVRRSLHPPIPSSVWGIGLPAPLVPTWLRHGLGHQPGELCSSEPSPRYLRRCDVYGPLFSCLHRSRRSPFFCRLHTLAIDNRRAGALLAALSTSEAVPKYVVDLLPGPVISPLLEVHVDRRVRGKVVREHPPSAAAAQDVEDGVDHQAEVCRTRPAPRLGCWEQRGNNPPFRVAEVAQGIP
jgi:hypothetical protein